MKEASESNNDLQVGVAPPAPAGGEKKSGGGGIKIPGPELPALLACLAVAVLALRRRR